MGKRGRGHNKYSDAFKTQIVAETRSAGSSIVQIAELHGVTTSQIYGWRQDKRFQGVDADASNVPGFVAVEVDPSPPSLSDAPIVHPTSNRIEITLENGRRLSISEGVDASFVLELARGLAA
jgi:transposase